VTLAAETSRHDGKLAEMADPRKGHKIVTTTAHVAAAIKAWIADDPAATTTKGKAPTVMVQSQDVESKRGMTHPHHHQAAAMAATAADRHDPVTPERIHHKKTPTTRAPG
jgi:hypothetical protein